MPPDLLRARRRALIVMLVVAIAPLLSGAGALHARSSIKSGSRTTGARTIGSGPETFTSTSGAIRDSVARSKHSADTSEVHEQLRKLITRFQDLWRKTWQDAEMARHSPLDVMSMRQSGDATVDRFTPERRRYRAALCVVGSPDSSAIESALKRDAQMRSRPFGTPAERPAFSVNTRLNLSIATGNMIVPKPNYGPICPNWVPEDAPMPADEGDGIDNALPIEERIPIEMARDTLIERMATALTQYPQDDWIAGQLVRFTVDQRVPGNSIRAARRCTQASSVCASLQGLAFEHAGNFVAAEAAFRRSDSIAALRSRSKDALCVDAAVLYVLPAGDRDKITDADCPMQRTLVDRLWWLADPLWGVPGNERYVAHGSRLTSIALRSVVGRDERYVWDVHNGGNALREVVMRYGWPSYTYWPGFELQSLIQTMLDLMPARKTQTPYTVKEYLLNQSALVSGTTAILDPYHVTNADWDMRRPVTTRQDQWWAPEHMAYRTHIVEMAPGQDVMWRRDTAIVYQLSVDDPLTNRDTLSKAFSRAVLWGGANPASTRKLADAMVDEGNTLRLKTEFSSAPLVLSAEVLPRTQAEQALRNRYGRTPPPTLREMKTSDLALSDPIFMRMPNREMALPTDEANVLRYMAGGLRFLSTEPVALYWESYGFLAGDTVQVELKIRRDDNVNVARRAAAFLGVASSLRDSVRIKWTEPDARSGRMMLSAIKPVLGRAVALDLQSLEPGAYVAIIEMRTGMNATARSERRFEIYR